MPKKVDHEARRQEIAEALWRIAATRGLDDVSLRDVAAEAGVSLGRLQHYFRTKDEMLLFALRRVSQLAEARIRQRIEVLAEEPSPRVIVRECLLGMLPADERSRIGTLVGAAYHARAVHDARLRTEASEGIPQLRDFFAGLLRQAVERGEISADRDPEDEAMILISLVGGLADHVLLDVHTADEARRLTESHLARLFTP